MAKGRRRAAGGSGAADPQVRVKTLKLAGRKCYVLRWTDPATGKLREEATDVAALERNRTRALRAAGEKERQVMARFAAGDVDDRSSAPHGHSVREICDKHVAWARRERSPALARQRASLLKGLCAHRVGPWAGEPLHGDGELLGDVKAELLGRPHIEQFLGAVPRAAASRRASIIAVKAAWNWAARPRKDGGGGLLRDGHSPLARLSRGQLDPHDLTEADLPTAGEIKAIELWGKVEASKVRAGTGRWRKRRPDEFYESPDAKTFGDMLRIYHATGARTGELCALVAGDVMLRTRQVCLGKHKRSSTQRNPTVRNIQLGEEALAIVRRYAEGKAPGDPLFARHDGRPWTTTEIDRRFRALRELAAEHKQPIRDHVTAYSFRHLYITELLMLGEATFKVAKMAGTSTREIDRTYGHFFNADLAEAQRRLDDSRAAARAQLGEDKGGKHPLHTRK